MSQTIGKDWLQRFKSWNPRLHFVLSPQKRSKTCIYKVLAIIRKLPIDKNFRELNFAWCRLREPQPTGMRWRTGPARGKKPLSIGSKFSFETVNRCLVQNGFETQIASVQAFSQSLSYPLSYSTLIPFFAYIPLSFSFPFSFSFSFSFWSRHTHVWTRSKNSVNLF